MLLHGDGRFDQRETDSLSERVGNPDRFHGHLAHEARRTVGCVHADGASFDLRNVPDGERCYSMAKAESSCYLFVAGCEKSQRSCFDGS